MEGFNYYTESDISLEHIQKCVEGAGYSTRVFFLGFRQLNILFAYQQGVKTVESYCRWNKVLRDVSDLEVDEQNRLKHLNLNPQALFSVDYIPATLPSIRLIVKIIMECYGGYLSSEERFYTINTIESFRPTFE